MTIRELDSAVLRQVNEDNIYTELNRLEGRIDFLTFCKDIPEDVRERELNNAHVQMNMFNSKLLILGLRGVL
jgi:hypothetical protein